MKKLLAIVISMAMIVAMMPMGVFADEGEKGTEANPYSLSELSNMTREAYITAQNKLDGTMYVNVGDYRYDTNGVLGNGERNDKPGQIPDHSKLNAYAENGYLNAEGEAGKKNDGANGKNIVFVGGTITSSVTGYASIDNIGTSLLLAVPAYTNVTFKNTVFNNVLSFNYQLYTSPWSQLGELKFDDCTFNGIIVGGIAAQTLTFNGCTFNNYTNATYPNSSNPTWIRPAYGNWTPSDNEGQGSAFKSLTTINFTNNTVTSTRPVKFERVAQWKKDTEVTITGNTFNISAQSKDNADKKMGVYLDSFPGNGENKPTDYSNTGAINLIWENNAIEGDTTCAICLDEYKNDLPPRSKVTDTKGNEIVISAKEWKTAKDITIGNEASIGENGYTTLYAAIVAANAGEVVKLLGNVSLSEELVVDKAITIDGNGNTITIANDTNEHLIELKANVTIKNITLDSDNKAKGVNTYGTDRSLAFIFENVKMINSKGTGLTAKGGTVTLNNVEVSGSSWKQSVDISNSNEDSFTNGANLVIDSKCALKDELAIVYDHPENNKLGEITASGWNVAYKDQAFGENEAKYTKRIFTLTKQSTGGGAVVPPVTDNVTNNTTDKNTTADLTPAVSDNKSTTTVDSTTADKIVDKAVANKSTEVIVDAAGNNTVASSEVAIPEKTVKELAEKTDANLVIKTDNGKVDLDKTALEAVAAQAGTTGTVRLVVETVKTDENICHVDLKLITSNGAVKDFRGGNVKVTINLDKELAAKELVCVYIDDNGIYTLVEGVLNADGTYTFITGHFSEYAIMAKAEAEKVRADQLNTLIKEVNLKVRTSKTSKKNIKAVVSGDVKALTDAGYTVKYKFYRSTKKASKYAVLKTKADNTYINTKGKKGTKYYYKAKALVYQGDKLVGQTVLTQCKYGARTWSK